VKVKKQLVIAVIAVLCLAVTLFVTIPTRSQTGTEYDPWVDVNDDGSIDMADISIAIDKFMTSGTPGTKASIEYDSGWIDITDKCGKSFYVVHNLGTTDIMVDIQGKPRVDGTPHQIGLGGAGYSPYWTKRYDYRSDEKYWDRAYAMVRTSDGGYMIAMEHSEQQYEDQQSLVFITKVDASGNVEFRNYLDRTFQFGAVHTDIPYNMIQTSDGGYAIAITMNIGEGADQYGMVCKVNQWGDHEYYRDFIGSNAVECRSIVQNDDGSYWALLNVKAIGEPDYIKWVKLTSDLNIITQIDWKWGTQPAYGDSLIRTADGGLAMTGTYDAGDPQYMQVFLLKTDGDGNWQWDYGFGGAGYEAGDCLIQTVDGGYAIAGTSTSIDPMGAMYLIKTYSDGTLQWEMMYGGDNDDGATSIIQTAFDRGFAIAGYTAWAGHTYDFYLVKTNENGVMQWERRYGGKYTEIAMCLVEAIDGSFVMAGYKEYSYEDAYVVKVDCEIGLSWFYSTTNTIRLYRGATDPYWNYVRVRIWTTT